MFSPEVTAMLRAVLDEVCVGISVRETSTKALVVAKLLESATKGELNADALRSIGHSVLRLAPRVGG